LTWMYILQLNYWRGPIDAWTLCQNIGGQPPSPPAHQDRRPCSHAWWATKPVVHQRIYAASKFKALPAS